MLYGLCFCWPWNLAAMAQPCCALRSSSFPSSAYLQDYFCPSTFKPTINISVRHAHYSFPWLSRNMTGRKRGNVNVGLEVFHHWYKTYCWISTSRLPKSITLLSDPHTRYFFISISRCPSKREMGFGIRRSPSNHMSSILGSLLGTKRLIIHVGARFPPFFHYLSWCTCLLGWRASSAASFITHPNISNTSSQRASTSATISTNVPLPRLQINNCLSIMAMGKRKKKAFRGFATGSSL